MGDSALRHTVSEIALMPCVRCCILCWPRNEEEQREHAGAEDREIANDVHIGQVRRLRMKQVIDVGLALMHRAERWTATRGSRAIPNLELFGHRLYLRVEPWIA